MNTSTGQKKAKKNAGNLVASKVFADVFQAYLECGAEVQTAIRDMVQVVNSSDATAEEREAALATIAEALFPGKHNDALELSLEDSEDDAPQDMREILEQMDQEEATFAERVNALLEARNMTQAELAAAIGIGQPAVSMMLARACRPQRRTVEKIALALRVAPEEIWPGIKSD